MRASMSSTVGLGSGLGLSVMAGRWPDGPEIAGAKTYEATERPHTPKKNGPGHNQKAMTSRAELPVAQQRMSPQ